MAGLPDFKGKKINFYIKGIRFDFKDINFNLK